MPEHHICHYFHQVNIFFNFSRFSEFSRQINKSAYSSKCNDNHAPNFINFMMSMWPVSNEAVTDSSLPNIDVMFISRPLNTNNLIWIWCWQTATVNKVILHITQTLFQIGQWLGRYLHHQAVLNDARLGTQSWRLLQGSVEDDKTGTSHWPAHSWQKGYEMSLKYNNTKHEYQQTLMYVSNQASMRQRCHIFARCCQKPLRLKVKSTQKVVDSLHLKMICSTNVTIFWRNTNSQSFYNLRI